MSPKVLNCAIGSGIVTAIAHHTELVKRNTYAILRIDRNFKEHFSRNKRIEILKGCFLVSIRHKECWNSAREAAKMVADASFNGILLVITRFCLNGFNNSFRRFFDRFLTVQLFMNILHHLIITLELALRIFIVQLGNFCLRCSGFLSLSNLGVLFLFKLIITDGIITIFPTHNRIRCFQDSALQLILRRPLQSAPILLPSSFHKDVCDWL